MVVEVGDLRGGCSCHVVNLDNWQQDQQLLLCHGRPRDRSLFIPVDSPECSLTDATKCCIAAFQTEKLHITENIVLDSNFQIRSYNIYSRLLVNWWFVLLFLKHFYRISVWKFYTIRFCFVEVLCVVFYLRKPWQQFFLTFSTNGLTWRRQENASQRFCRSSVHYYTKYLCFGNIYLVLFCIKHRQLRVQERLHT